MAKLQHVSDVHPEPMLDGVTMRVVIGPAEGAPVFNMRIFEVQPGKATPFHQHWWEHEVYILEGTAMLKLEARETPLVPGTAILVERNEKHQFVNTGTGVMRFMCLVPQDWLVNMNRESCDGSGAVCC